jgi:2-dehydropantoate 2-reductase
MQSGQDLREYEEIAGRERTIGANPHYGGALVDPGHLEAGFPNYIWIGELDGSFTPRLRQLQLDLCNWTPTLMTDDILGTVWSKFAVGFRSVSTALTDRPSDDALSDERHRFVSAAAVREAVRVFDSLGLDLEAFDFFDPDVYRIETAEDVQGFVFWMEAARRRYEVFRKHGYHDYAKTGSGMRWDIAYRKRPSDSAARLSAMKQASARADMPIPLITALVSMIREIEEGKRPMGPENVDELAALFEEHGATSPVHTNEER